MTRSQTNNSLRWPVGRRRPPPLAPVVDVDLCSVSTLRSPEESYRAIRDAGPVVWLRRHRVWAMGRFEDVRAALRDDDLYRNRDAVSFNPFQRRVSRRTSIGSDGDVHTRRRKILLESLGAKALRPLTPDLDVAAKDVIDDLLSRDSFNGVTDFASRLPISVVSDMVGVHVPPDMLLRWGRVAFDGNGPLTNLRVVRATPTAVKLWLYSARLNPSKVKPGSWAAAVLAAGERGDLSRAEAKNMVVDFVVPSLDTTILAAAQLLWSLGTDSQAWDRLRTEPALIPHAIMEAVRLASPVRLFTRMLSRDAEVGGVTMRAGDRVALIFAAANTDERQFPDPLRFDLERRGTNLGWGFGTHACVGMHLSKLEMEALLKEMVQRVEAITVSDPQRLINNGLQGLKSFRVTFR
jgi:cytochrome P450